MPGWNPGDERVAFAEWAKHGGAFGWAHVGLGSDMDGGFGMQEAPAGLEVYGDLLDLLYDAPLDLRTGVAGGTGSANTCKRRRTALPWGGPKPFLRLSCEPFAGRTTLLICTEDDHGPAHLL